MPPTEPGGMAKFVHRHAKAPDRSRLTGPGDASIASAVLGTRLTTFAPRQSSRSRQPEAVSLRARPDPGHLPFLDDTDASAADRTSTTANRHEHGTDAESSTGHEVGSDDEYYTNSVQAGQSRPQAVVQFNERQREWSKGTNQNHGQHPSRSGFPDIRGDSYPSTTSGQPSVANQSEKARHRPPLPDRATQAADQPEEREPVGNAKQEYARRLANVREQNGFFSSPTAADNPLAEVDYGFMASKSTVTKSQPPARPSVVSLSGAAAREPEQVDNLRGCHHPQQEPTRTAFSHQLQQPKRLSRLWMPTNQSSQDKAYVPIPKEEDEQSERLQAEEEQPSDDELKLDYAAPDLHAMDFRALKAEKFDVDPNASPFTLPPDLPASTLAEKLASVSTMQPQRQVEFFSTLDINQWEEAGEWFLGRFGEIVSKLKTARREKREAALQFEDEIEKHHEAISKKRKLTEEALSDMKASGAQVLQGTPDKAKKFKETRK